jgi:hypothetical protein
MNRRLQVTTVVLFVAVALPAGVSATTRTTNPQAIYKARVIITNVGIDLRPTKVARGALVQFHVRNASTSSRDFFIGGYLVHKLGPGATRNFQLQFLERGTYKYYSVGHPGKKFGGVLKVA